MKMMKTDMEFVAFDAQDVIATSGGLTAMFTVSGDLYSGPNGASGFNYKGNGKWNWSGADRQKLWVDDEFPTDGTTYILTEGVSSYQGYVNTGNIYVNTLQLYGVTEGTKANVTLTSLGEIVSWLGDYGKKQ